MCAYTQAEANCSDDQSSDNRGFTVAPLSTRANCSNCTFGSERIRSTFPVCDIWWFAVFKYGRPSRLPLAPGLMSSQSQLEIVVSLGLVQHKKGSFGH